MKTTNYYNTFIAVAEDCPAALAEVPPKKQQPTVADLQFEMIASAPYRYTSDDVIFQVYAMKQEIQKSELKVAREQFFSKGQACLRSSPLSKRYGWGIHCNEEGRVALYAIESQEYQHLLKDKNLKQVKAMRSKR